MTQPHPTPYPAQPPAPSGRRPLRPVDTTVTILGLVLLATGALAVTLLALVIGAFVESGDPDNNTASDLAAWLAPTWLLFAVALTASVMLLRRRVLAFWVPLVAGGLWYGVVYLLFNA